MTARRSVCAWGLLLAGAARAVLVGGTVVTPAGPVVPRAQVCAVVDDVSYLATADAAGRWRLDVPAPAGVAVTLFARTETQLGWYYGPAGTALSVVLSPTTPCTGVLRDGQRRAVAGASLTVAKVLTSPNEHDRGFALTWPPAPWPALACVTDGLGHWSLDGLSDDLAAHALAVSPRHAPAYVTLFHAGCRETLDEGGTTRGTVKLADGSPAAGVTVVAGCRLESGDHDDAVRTTVTAADGGFELRGLLRWGTTLIRVLDPATGLVSSLQRATDNGKPLALTAVKGVTLRVKAVDRATQQGLASVPLSLQPHDTRWGDALTARTDAAGVAQFVAPPGKYALSAPSHDRQVDTPGDVTLTLGETPLTPTVTLAPLRALRGVLTEFGGGPLPGLTLLCRGTGEEYLTDAAGGFTLRGLTTHGDTSVAVVEPCGYTRGELKLEGAKLPADVWRPTLPPLPHADLAGRVTDAAGQPLAGVEVALKVTQAAAAGGDDQPEFVGGPQGGAPGLVATTDARGQYTFRRLPVVPGLTLDCRRAGYLPRRELKVTGDAGALRVEPVALTPLDGRVAGRVVDAGGRPLAGATLLALGHRGAEATTDADGRFTLDRLPPGKLTLLALHGTTVRGEARTSTGTTGLVLKAVPFTAPTAEEERELVADAIRRLWTRTGETPGVNRPQLLQAMALADPPGALELLAKLKADDNERDALYAAAMVCLANVAPRQCLEQLGFLAKIGDADARLAARAQVGLALAAAHADLAAMLYEAVRDAKPDGEPTAFAIDRVTLAARLGRAEAPKLAAAALKALPADKYQRASLLHYAALAWADQSALAALVNAAASDGERPVLRMLAPVGVARRDARAALGPWLAAAPPTAESDEQNLRAGAARLLAATCTLADPEAAEALADTLDGGPARLLYLRLLTRAAAPEVRRRLAIKALLNLESGGEADTPGLAGAVRQAAPDLLPALVRRLARNGGDERLATLARGDLNAARLLGERALAQPADGLDQPLNESANSYALMSLGAARALALASEPQPGREDGSGQVFGQWVLPPELRGDPDLLTFLVAPDEALANGVQGLGVE